MAQLLLILLSSLYLATSTVAVDYDLPTANLSTLWINNGSNSNAVAISNDSSIDVVLTRGTPRFNNNGPTYVCGFYCNGHAQCDSYMFVIAIVMTGNGGGTSRTTTVETCPQVVWSANRNSPVKINSTLELTSGGDLVLKDVDGTIAWSTNTSGKSISGMNLTEEGNLVLFDNNNTIIWQSFDFPTDSLVPGQRLRLGQKLTPSVSSRNWTESSLLSFAMTAEGLVGLMNTDPPQIFSRYTFNKSVGNRNTTYVEYVNGSLSLFLNSKLDRTVITVPVARSVQYMRLSIEGHLRIIEWSSDAMKWTRVGDLSTGELGRCGYPRVCGDYGICTHGQCSCPKSNGEKYFRPLDDRKPDLGCSQVMPLSCGDQSFIELADVFYFASDFFTSHEGLQLIDSESCKRACSRNCSCKAAIFQYRWNVSDGYCYFLSQVFSLMNNDQDRTHRNSTVYLKVHKTHAVGLSSRGKKTERGQVIFVSIFGALFGLCVLIGVGLLIWKIKYGDHEPDKDHLDQVLGNMPIRFSYEELKSATSNFTKKLGEGGFGSVFQGVMIDGTKVAVKQLEGLGTIKNSFLAEVETIGSIHHFNLVRLVGFCAEKSHRLLVYEYMPNGSLDRWIFHKKNDDFNRLGWQQRKKIILDVAKGLNYLHEDCRHKIIHMDIKPENILLDDNFNAKLSDFGLSKLINKHERQITFDSTTTVRGTPGYLAPECLKAVVSDKVDVYSFGVVILEIMCGRKVLDVSLCEEYMHLVGLFKTKAKDEKLLDMVDKCIIDDMELHDEVMNMMRIAAWCLIGDSEKRPSISMVVKVLDGSVEDERFEIDPDLINLPWMEVEAAAETSFLQSAYVLSDPR